MSAWCKWWNKRLENVTEQEQEACARNGETCLNCVDMCDKGDDIDNEGSGRE